MVQNDKALHLYEMCLTKYKQILGDDHPDTLHSMNNLANLYHSMGQNDKALHLYEMCLAKRKQILGNDHPDTLHSMNNLANFYHSMGQNDHPDTTGSC